MKIFTKSMLTLLLLCFAGVVNAQETIKGWFEVDATPISREPGWGAGDHESRFEDGAYLIYARSSEGIDGYVAWDTQFFVTIGKGNALKPGAKFRLRMNVKADFEASNVDTQVHQAPGSYNANLGKINFTESWDEYDSGEITLSSDQAKGDGFYTVAINLGLGSENTFYFKDIVFEVYGDKPATPTAVSETWEWTEHVKNGDCEGDDVSSFYVRYWQYVLHSAAYSATIVDGAGKDGTRGVKVEATERNPEHIDESENYGGYEWDNQFWIYLDEYVPAGTKYSASFDYRADEDATVGTQTHDTPADYVNWNWWGSFDFKGDWQSFSKESTVTAEQADNGSLHFRSIAFNLNPDSHPGANTYYIDNVSFKTGVLINDVKNDEYGGFRILFTEYTNMPDLVKAIAGKKRRIVLPEELAKAAFQITINGTEAPVESVEYDKDGSLYVFLSEDYPDYPIAATAEVKVKFTNPTDAKYQLKYTRGENINQAVEDFEMKSTFDDEIDLIPNSWLSPELESSDPENGSFCLPASTSYFTLTFDKAVKADKIEAKLDGSEKLTVAGDAEYKEIVHLSRKNGAAALTEGKHTISVTRVFALNDVNEYEDSPAELSFSVGEAAIDQKLQRALDKAAAALEESSEGRYQGEAYAALKEAYEKYSAEAINYTAPSQVEEATTELSVKTEAQSQHFKRCNDYDNNLQEGESLVSEFADSKFNKHELFNKLSTAVGKYSGKVLTDDAELKTAIDELKGTVAEAKAMFTTGKPHQGTTGIAALVERIRMGAETLTTNFGMTDADELIVAANNVLEDNDELAAEIKKAILVKYYEKVVAGAQESLFSETVDENGDGDVIVSGPNMSVFIKNPNVYRLSKNVNINTTDNVGNCPVGWTINSGSTKLSDGWNAVDADIVDAMFEGWGATFDISQDIIDLPAGTYKVNFAIGERQIEDEAGRENIYAYVKTTDTEETQVVPYINQTFPTLAQNRVVFNDVVVKDGQLTIGFHGEGSSIFMEEVELQLVGIADGIDYAADLEAITNGVKDIKTVAKRRVYYDLQGRRVAKPTKGLYITNSKKVVVK